MTIERFSATKDFIVQQAVANSESLIGVAAACGIPLLIYGYMTLVAMTAAKTNGESATEAARAMWSAFPQMLNPRDVAGGMFSRRETVQEYRKRKNLS